MLTAEHRTAFREQLRQHEGLRLRAYHDTMGRLTIGIGRNLDSPGITSAEAYYLLDNDIRRCEVEATKWPWFEGLTQVRQRVILDMLFNLGWTRLAEFRQTLGAVSSGEYERASREMLISDWAVQVGARARRLAKMMHTGEVME